MSTLNAGVWVSRIILFLLGVAAWGLSYFLAVSFGSGAPFWLVRAITLFVILYGIIGVISFLLDYRDGRERDLDQLERDVYSLTNEIRQVLISTPPAWDAYVAVAGRYAFDPVVLHQFEVTREGNLARTYEQRFSTRVRNIGQRFLRQRLPRTDGFFRLIASEPQGQGDITQLNMGMERIIRELRDPRGNSQAF